MHVCAGDCTHSLVHLKHVLFHLVVPVASEWMFDSVCLPALLKNILATHNTLQFHAHSGDSLLSSTKEILKTIGGVTGRIVFHCI